MTCALLWAAAAGATAEPAPAGASAAERLAAAGIQPLLPPPPAPDFTLPLLGGGELTLSGFQGRWVVLTFFATWCGPCRSEMPTLEGLHRGPGAAERPAIVAVSLDRDRGPLEAFAAELGLTLPVAWDRTGGVGDLYLASSIPITYLIDPAGGVAGVARGARDWTAVEPLLASLPAAAPAADSAPRYAAGPLALPEVLAPPTAEWSLPEAAARPGRPFVLEVLLRWSGQLSDYLPQPPRLTLPEGIRQQRVEAASGSAEGAQQVRYRIELVAERAGSYALDPIELRYLPAFAAGPSTELVAGPTIEVAAADSGLRPAGLAAGALVALGLAALWWRRRRVPGPAAPAPPWERLRGEIDRARGLRLAGEPGGAFEALAAVAAELETPAERADLEKRLEAVRFGGSRPGGGELEAIERRLERALESRRPDPDAERRRRLRLRSHHPSPNPEET